VKEFWRSREANEGAAVCAALLRGKTPIVIIGLQSGAAMWRHRLACAKGT